MKGLVAWLFPPVAALTLVLAAGSTGCDDASSVPPVPDSVMVSVLADLHVAGARLRLEPDLDASVRDSVLARHGLDSARYADASAWLREHPENLVALYGAAVDRLNERREP